MQNRIPFTSRRCWRLLGLTRSKTKHVLQTSGAVAILLSIAAAMVVASAATAEVNTPAVPESERSEPLPKLDYGRHIRPILSQHCLKCHGPDEKERKGVLRLDSREFALAPAESGKAAIVPGQPEASELVARITSPDADLRMPPAATKQKLTPQEIDLLKRWIAQGADQKLHWSYVKPRRPPVPAIQSGEWVRTGIDYFILQQLQSAGLQPAPEADRSTLLRRLSLDLTGLPPTIAEVDDFVGDSAPDAYEKLVDRLMASPHFGERLAQDWLDLSRYGDTNGYENDSERSIWKYRDWVINAFNGNLPFDRFTIEQIAGDLLPDATSEQRTATGFSRNVTYNEEGGADPDEYMVKYAVDRTNTAATVFLGMTTACAECHDHKYDPITQRDFYSLFAYFNSVDGEKGAQGHDVPLPPLISFPTPEQTATLERTRSELADLDQRVKQEVSKFSPDTPASPTANGTNEVREYIWIDDSLPTSAVPQGNEDSKSWKWDGAPAHQVRSGKLSHSRTAKGFARHEFTGTSTALNIGEGDKLFAYVFLDPQDPPKTLLLQFHNSTWEHRAFWGEDLVPSGVAGTPSRRSLGPLPHAGAWVRLEVDAQAIGLTAGSVVDGLSFGQVDGKVFWDQAGIVTKSQQPPLPSDSQTAWEEFELRTPNPPSKTPKAILELLQMARDKRTDAQKSDLRQHFARYVYGPARATLDPLNARMDELKALETKTEKLIPTTMVMSEMAERRPAFVLMRGNYQTPGEQVKPNVPSFLPPLPEGAPPNRLGLARWLVDRNNPLTARVTVNRFWKQFFGTGLVKTLEDFGSQGEYPSHPELLDWLACEFAGDANAWDIKHLLRLIVTSATYRQGATPRDRLADRDPFNRLLAHSARFRLSAEAIRDNALLISGLLHAEIGGKSVHPYQPPDYYADKGRWVWTPSTGSQLYRRGLYTFWRRTTFYPSFQVFDAPTRENCTVDRPRTNTPLQALITLNDPAFVEAARVFGQRIMQEGGETVDQKVTFAFRLCVARPPTGEELGVLHRVHASQLAKYQADAAAAKLLVSNGTAPRPENLPVAELAAWTAVGNLLLNLDETMTRE